MISIPTYLVAMISTKLFVESLRNDELRIYEYDKDVELKKLRKWFENFLEHEKTCKITWSG